MCGVFYGVSPSDHAETTRVANLARGRVQNAGMEAGCQEVFGVKPDVRTERERAQLLLPGTRLRICHIHGTHLHGLRTRSYVDAPWCAACHAY
jgi:hypothetical protein